MLGFLPSFKEGVDSFKGLFGDSMDMSSWSPERKRFYEQYGYDRGPLMRSPMDQQRSPNITEVITETEPSDPTPTKKVTTIKYPDADESLLSSGSVPPTNVSDPYASLLDTFISPSQATDQAMAGSTYVPELGSESPLYNDPNIQEISPSAQDQNTDQTMNAIMMAESGGDPNAYYSGATPDRFMQTAEDSIGLFQINWDFWGGQGYDIINAATRPLLGRDLEREDLFDPEINRAAASAIQESEGFTPWSTYTSGKYLDHMGSAPVEAPVEAPPRGHTAEDPDWYNPDAPPDIPQDIYNILRDNHFSGQDVGILGDSGPSDVELAEAQEIAMTNPALELTQREGEKFHAPAVLNLFEQDYIAGSPDPVRRPPIESEKTELQIALESGNTEGLTTKDLLEGDIVLWIDENGDPVTKGRIEESLPMAMMPGGGIASVGAGRIASLLNARKFGKNVVDELRTWWNKLPKGKKAKTPSPSASTATTARETTRLEPRWTPDKPGVRKGTDDPWIDYTPFRPSPSSITYPPGAARTRIPKGQPGAGQYLPKTETTIRPDARFTPTRTAGNKGLLDEADDIAARQLREAARWDDTLAADRARFPVGGGRPSVGDGAIPRRTSAGVERPPGWQGPVIPRGTAPQINSKLGSSNLNTAHPQYDMLSRIERGISQSARNKPVTTAVGAAGLTQIPNVMDWYSEWKHKPAIDKSITDKLTEGKDLVSKAWTSFMQGLESTEEEQSRLDADAAKGLLDRAQIGGVNREKIVREGLLSESPNTIYEEAWDPSNDSIKDIADDLKRLEDDSSGIPPDALTGDLRGSLFNKGDAEKVLDESLDSNRIWDHIPKDTAGKRERYLKALNEVYKKMAILNAISALTGAPSMAAQFLELASDKFEKLEGFEGEDRLAKIAKVVNFKQREDGSYQLDLPTSKEEVYERAIAAGATHKEASTMAGTSVLDEKDQYYRDKGDGTWEVVRSSTDPGENWIEGDPPATPPSARTTTTTDSRTALEKKLDQRRMALVELEMAKKANNSLEVDRLEYELRALDHALQGRTDELNRTLHDVQQDLFEFYKLKYKGIGGNILPTSPAYYEWLLGEGLTEAKAMGLTDEHIRELKRRLGKGEPPKTRQEAYNQIKTLNPNATDEEINIVLDKQIWQN